MLGIFAHAADVGALRRPSGAQLIIANHVYAEAAKVAFEIEFPVVEGYQDPGIVKVAVDWDKVGELVLDPKVVPDETLLRALVAADGNLTASPCGKAA